MRKLIITAIMLMGGLGLSASDSAFIENAKNTLNSTIDSAGFNINAQQYDNGKLIEKYSFQWASIKNEQQIHFPGVISIYQFGKKAIVEMPEDKLVIYYENGYQTLKQGRKKKRKNTQVLEFLVTQDSVEWTVGVDSTVQMRSFTHNGYQLIHFSKTGKRIVEVETHELLPDMEDGKSMDERKITSCFMQFKPLDMGLLKRKTDWITKGELKRQFKRFRVSIDKDMKQVIKRLLTICIAFQLSTAALAYDKTFTTGYHTLISQSHLDTVKDEQYSAYGNSTNTWYTNFYNQKTVGKVQFWIDRNTLYYVPDKCDITVYADITVYRYIPGQVGIDSSTVISGETFILKYDTAAAAKEIDKVTRTYENAVKLKVQITAIQVSNSILGFAYPHTQLPMLQYEYSIDVQRNKNLANQFVAPSNFYRVASSTSHKIPYYNYIWNPIEGAEAYEVSYKFIETNLTSSSHPVLNGTEALNFMHDANIVEVSDANELMIPDIFPNGYLICRVRARGVHLNDLSKIQYTPWSIPDLVTYNFSTNPDADSFMMRTYNMDSTKNWYYKVAFSEGAQTHNAISYFDGLMRERQSMAYQNSNNTVVVSQSIFDYFGRQTVKVMPSPALDNLGFEFRSQFNKDENGGEYTYEDFDLNQPGTDDIKVNAMSSVFGTNQYYSANSTSFIESSNDLSNSEKMMHWYLPKANGYAFAQTEQTMDGTGRSSRTGQVGKTHQLDAYNSGGTMDSGHAVRVYDGTPDQPELDLLFGSEVGYAQNYKKGMTRDANGQIRVAYSDLSGNTIATALAGKVPDNMEALNSSDQVITLKAPIPNTIEDPYNLVKEASRHILVTEQNDTWRFDYELDRLALANECENVCFQCAYDLTLSVTDALGNEMIPDGPITQSLGFIDSFKCDSFVTFVLMPNPLELVLQPGEYAVHKSLQISKSAMDSMREAYLSDTLCSLNLASFLLDELARNGVNCDVSCEDCDDEKANMLIEKDSIVQDALNNSLDTSSYAPYLAWKKSWTELDSLCEYACMDQISPCEIAYKMMLLDVTPGGQYALYNEYDDTGKLVATQPHPTLLGNLGSWKCDNGAVNKSWRNPKDHRDNQPYYKNGDGTRAYIPLKSGDLSKLKAGAVIQYIDGKMYANPEDLATVELFIKYWQESWMYSLVYHHPEFCQYEACGAMEESYQYDIDMLKTQSAAEAIKKGYFNPLGMGSLGSIEHNGVTITLDYSADEVNPQRDPITATTYYQGQKIIAGQSPIDREDLFKDSLSTYIFIENDPNFTIDDEHKSIWKVYEEIRAEKGLYPGSIDTCVDDLFWPILRAFYMDVKRQWLKEYYSNACANSTACNDGEAIPTYRIKRFNPQIEDVLGHDSFHSRWATVNKHTSKDDLSGKLDEEMADQCKSQCEANVKYWMQSLENCTLINAGNKQAIHDDLVKLCQSGCDYQNPYGSVTRAPYNDGNSTYPEKDIDAVLKKWLGTNYFSAGICDDALINFPGAYGHDYLAYNKPSADTCACDSIKWKSQNCPNLVHEGDKLEDCICNNDSMELKQAKLSALYLPESYKCQDCIDCNDLEAPVKAFFTKYANAPDTASDSSLYHTLLTNYLNRHFGFNMDYADYDQFAKECTGMADTVWTAKWRIIAVPRLRNIIYVDATEGPIFRNTLNEVILANSDERKGNRDGLVNRQKALGINDFENSQFTTNNSQLISPWESIFGQKDESNLYAGALDMAAPMGPPPPQFNAQTENVACHCRKILSVQKMMDDGQMGPGASLYNSTYSPGWVGTWNFENMKNVCCNLWNTQTASIGGCDSAKGFNYSMDYHDSSKNAIQSLINSGSYELSLLADDAENPCNEEPESELKPMDTCACKKLKQFQDDWATAPNGQMANVPYNQWLMDNKNISVPNVAMLLNWCSNLWETGAEKDKDGSTLGTFSAAANWNGVSAENLKEYATDMDLLVPADSLLCTNAPGCTDYIPCAAVRALIVAAGRNNLFSGVIDQQLGGADKTDQNIITALQTLKSELSNSGTQYEPMDYFPTAPTSGNPKETLLYLLYQALQSSFSLCSPPKEYPLSFYLNLAEQCGQSATPIPACTRKLDCDSVLLMLRNYLGTNPTSTLDPNASNEALMQAFIFNVVNYREFGDLGSQNPALNTWANGFQNFLNTNLGPCTPTPKITDWMGGFASLLQCYYVPEVYVPVAVACPNCYSPNDTLMADWMNFLNQVTQKDNPNYLRSNSWPLQGTPSGMERDFRSFYNSSLYGKQGYSDSTNLKWKITEYKIPKMAMKIYDASGYTLNTTLSFPTMEDHWNFGEILSFINIRLAPHIGCEPNRRYLIDAIYKRPKKYWSGRSDCPNYFDLVEYFCYDTVTMIGEMSDGLVSDVPCLGCAKLCNKPYAEIAVADDKCSDYDIETSFANAITRYQAYLTDKINWFDSSYTQRCMATPERFNVEYKNSQHHYMLYYYDRAGQLIKTVPPAGVDISNTSISNTDRQALGDLRIAMAAAHRTDNTQAKAQTYHHLISRYQYSSTGQLYKSHSPEAGESKMYYDRLGRVQASQDQRDIDNWDYRYTLYDALGRSYEGGITKGNTIPYIMEEKTYSETDFNTWLATGNKYEVSRSYYTTALNQTAVLNTFEGGVPTNLQNALATSTYEKIDDGNDLSYDHGMYYSYDIHGQAKQVVQHIPTLDRFGKGIYNLEYDYELISGKTLKTAYQKGEVDQFFHKYNYDEDNRLVEALTSRDDCHYESDVRYSYYLHGMMGRKELGELRVQGLDYAYNLNGWIKSVNGANLEPWNDMGRDGDYNTITMNFGTINNPHQYVARDAFSFYNSYYQGDYEAVSGNPIEPNVAGSDAANNYHDLYNGNIAMMGTSIPDKAAYASSSTLQGAMMGNVYRYDQLNSITKHYNYTNLSGNQWGSNGQTGTDRYYEDFAYDANGNITALNRNGGSIVPMNIGMDAFAYQYDIRNFGISINYNGTGNNFNWNRLENNKLYHVNDNTNSSNYSTDIDDHGVFDANPAVIGSNNNYRYDKLGNLVGDVAEGISNIAWNSNGKIDSITRNNDPRADLVYGYDAVGHRMWKLVKPKDQSTNQIKPQKDWKKTYYVYDPSGNQMANYTETYAEEGNAQTIKANLHTQSWSIYGSERVGLQREEKELSHYTLNLQPGQAYQPGTGRFSIVSVSAPTNSTLNTHHSTLTRGCKVYELTNHLGNVLTNIQDRRTVRSAAATGPKGTQSVMWYDPYVVSATDYYAFGSRMEERGFVTASQKGYGYGFNNQEIDVELGEYLNFEYRVHDARLGRFLSVDPLTSKYPYWTPYQFAGNQVIHAKELEGLESNNPKGYGELYTVQQGDNLTSIAKRQLFAHSYTPAQLNHYIGVIRAHNSSIIGENDQINTGDYMYLPSINNSINNKWVSGPSLFEQFNQAYNKSKEVPRLLPDGRMNPAIFNDIDPYMAFSMKNMYAYEDAKNSFLSLGTSQGWKSLGNGLLNLEALVSVLPTERSYQAKAKFAETVAGIPNWRASDWGGAFGNTAIGVGTSMVGGAAFRSISLAKVPVYRVYGGQAGRFGNSWTFINPNGYGRFYRNFAGLPLENSGNLMIKGTVRLGDINKFHMARPIPYQNTFGRLVPELKIYNSWNKVNWTPKGVSKVKF